jgi:lysozyme-like protein
VTYTKKQVEGFWVKAGGNPALAPTMAAIAGAESSFGASPYGDVGLGGPGPTSFGLWQIHTPAHPGYNSSLLVSDPLYNARAAVAISGNSTGGLGAWTTYKTGAYKAYLGATGVSGSVNAGVTSSPTSTSSSSGSPETLAGAPGGLAGIAIKGFLYLALLVGAVGLLWIGSKTALQPRRKQ